MFPTRIASLAMEAAVEVSNGTDSELHVVHVVSTVPELPYPRAVAKERSEAILELRRLHGLRLLEVQARQIEELGGSVAATH